MSSWSDPSVFAAFLSAGAAIAAAIATWRGPLTAAKLSDILRVSSDRATNARQIRPNVFAAVMQGRAEIYNEDTVRALNLVDVAFSDDMDVREAWSELFQALSHTSPDHVIDERLRRLLRTMSINLGLITRLSKTTLVEYIFLRYYLRNEMFASLRERRRLPDLRAAHLLRRIARTLPTT
jgi:hypothetical protein